MKKIIITICAVVVCVLGAIIPVGETWAAGGESYDDMLKKAKSIETACGAKGAEWRDSDVIVDGIGEVECKAACAETTLMGTQGSGVKLTCDYKGVRIKEKLKLTIEIISVIVATLGVAAIVYVGILYLTAGPDVGKAAKAKTRIIEIIVGLVIYAFIFTILEFLIPNFSN